MTRPLGLTCLALALLLSLTAAGCGRRAAPLPLSQSFDARGVRLHYVVAGSGEPVVLLHGLYSSAAMNWERPGTFAALAKQNQVLALDLPGHGLSDRPEEAAAYGRQMVEDVVLLLDQHHVKKAHLVGYSMGGMIAMKLLALHPDRVLSATIGGMGWLRDGGGLQPLWRNLPSRGRTLRGGTPPACVASFGELALTEAELRGIRAPVEVLVGDRDPVRERYVRPLQAVRSDWPVIEIEGAGHLSCAVKPQFIREVVRWVERNRQP